MTTLGHSINSILAETGETSDALLKFGVVDVLFGEPPPGKYERTPHSFRIGIANEDGKKMYLYSTWCVGNNGLRTGRRTYLVCENEQTLFSKFNDVIVLHRTIDKFGKWLGKQDQTTTTLTHAQFKTHTRIWLALAASFLASSGGRTHKNAARSVLSFI